MPQEKEKKIDPAIDNTLERILEILETALNGSIELLYDIGTQKMKIVNTILNDLQQVVSVISDSYVEIYDKENNGNIREQLDNIDHTIIETRNALSRDEFSMANQLVEYQLIPFLHLLKEAFYFWGYVYPDSQKMDYYYEHEFAQNYKSPYFQDAEEPKYQLSIVITGYNHLETTKCCVKHVLQYADLQKLNAELVLIDHGSTDETLNFFRSIPNAKVIHFKNNVRMYMFAAIPLVCEGKYINFISNDVLVTKGWAEKLMECMESDSKIVAAVPMTPNISNLQMLSIPCDDPEKFVNWANTFNHADSRLWSDRARLMPPTCMYRMSAICDLGLADPYFYSMEFWDDDFSLRARRKGYRQILCENIACYHFGSMTSQEAKTNEGTLDFGRRLFLQKNHVDAWGIGFCYDYIGLQLIKKYLLPRKDEVNFLGIDCGMGDSALQARNELRHVGINTILYNLTVESAYIADLKPLSDYFEFVDFCMSKAIKKCFPNQTFDGIFFEKCISYYHNIDQIFVALRSRLSEKGKLFFHMENPWYALNLNLLLQFKLPQCEIHWMSVDTIYEIAKKVFKNVEMIPVKQKIEGVENFAKKFFGDYKKNMRDIVEKLSIQNYYFVCWDFE